MQISEGTFCGIEGTVVDHRGANRVIIAVELLETAVTIEIDVSRVQLLDAHQRMRFGR